jgi:hypothetical protein
MSFFQDERITALTVAQKESARSKGHVVFVLFFFGVVCSCEIYLEYHSVCPLVQVCPPPPHQRERGVWGPFGRLEKKPIERCLLRDVNFPLDECKYRESSIVVPNIL